MNLKLNFVVNHQKSVFNYLTHKKNPPKSRLLEIEFINENVIGSGTHLITGPFGKKTSSLF